MVSTEREPDPLNVEELARQAEAYVKEWRLPNYDDRGFRGEPKDWQRLMDERLVKPGWGN